MPRTADSTGFFTSFETGDPLPLADAGVTVGAGPERPLAARAGAGFTGTRALRFAAAGASRTTLFRVGLDIGADTELSYAVFPESAAEPGHRSTFVAIDLEFADGGRLSDSIVPDQYGAPCEAAGQGTAKTLYLDQWNLVRCRLGDHARGRRITAIVLVTAPPENETPGEGPSVRGWIDDLRIGDHARRGGRDQVDWVRTTRGSHSSRDFSRGGTFPATAVPQGFHFLTPVTNAGALDWLYEYHRGSDERNVPALQAFAVSHQPSPWMGDRHTFQVMPGMGGLTTGRAERALTFSHEDETDLPHHYGVRFACGIAVDIAPTDHAAVLRFTFPGPGGRLLFDNARNRGGLRVDPRRGVVTGHTWVRSRLSTGARRMYVHARVDARPTGGGRVRRPWWRTVTGTLTFDAPTVTLRLATSLISAEQARRNLEREAPDGTTFEQARDRARAAWQELLGAVEIVGATEDQLRTFYSNLYRLFLYPNSAHEDTGPPGSPRVRHASPVRRGLRPSTRRRTGAPVVDGELFVNNGFWDTYRTCWPAYALLAPRRCGELLDGFVQQYREGGWISRWSSPGYADLMTGTSSDVVLADAYLRGVRNFDVASAYDSALRNATVTPPSKRVGRKGISESIFLGYTPASTGEGLSWTLEGCVNDFGLAAWSRALHERCAPGDPRRAEYADNAAYFGDRALHYVHHFDPATGFFRGRHRDGSWRSAPDAFDPAAWGGDYTETNGWNTAFSAPHDGAGLAALHGGRTGLRSTLDTFFATPETGRAPGGYGGVIHEMTEARDVRLGQYGHSNQPSHHIPWMYLHAGDPAAAQRIVREVLRRLYVGGEIGQGYPGDEDNGEMSAWYVFAALGLYPLAPGNPGYAVGSPLFREVTVRLPGERALVVRARGEGVHVAGLTVDGTAWDRPWLPHDRLAGGAVLEFTLSTEPSGWGAAPGLEPPSVTAAGTRPAPATDLRGRAHGPGGEIPELTDDSTRTEAVLPGSTATIGYTVDEEPRPVLRYTLTSGARGGDPADWTLEGSADGVAWSVLDRRQGQRFRWRRQTRPFSLPEPASFPHYRLRVTAVRGRRLRLAQWELLAGTPQ
ncbi:alpha-1 2-mannosidase [Amycolatopsis antarctica]|uniref:Alpha-1 2-mannosidase n=1 Tax=Amycolatopsis antarctica TaxID=1854586 RepID=A0A263D331_9PSEU|nr:GH92 family glycosyl hydrolase [Amycolatopsis antarctica]OZM72873.1 alpha-1 2-mannosidase [Amycolatopsis antarctica]